MAVTYNNRKQSAPAVVKRALSGPAAGNLARPGAGAIGPAARSTNMVKPKKIAPTKRPGSLSPPSGGVFRVPAPSATYPSNTPKAPSAARTTGGAGPTARPGALKLPPKGGLPSR